MPSPADEAPKPDERQLPLPLEAGESDTPDDAAHITGSQPTFPAPTQFLGVKPAGSMADRNRFQNIQPGTRFGRYLVEQELGRGGMGTVYLAHDTHLDRKVALKIPRFKKGYSAEATLRFYREARSMATVQHANICPIYDVGETQGQPYLSMAYLEGRTLADLLRERKKLPFPLATRLIRTIALAVHHAHDAGLVHRDLKPSNIMMVKGAQPIVMDFGLARRSKRTDDQSDLTATGIVLGSPAYMAPEQVEARHEDVGPWTDIWAMGVMLYELLCGHRPFEGLSSGAVMGRIIEREPSTFSQLGHLVPVSLEEVCRKALSKDHTARYHSAFEFAQILERFGSESFHEKAPTTVRMEPKPSPAVAQSDSSVRKRDAELRQVTIAVFNYEADSSSQDLEKGSETALAFRQYVNERVRRFHGSTMASSGQEVLACFGFPVAYEDSVQRAVRAALAVIHDAKSGETSTRNLPPSETIWATLHTGDAIAEDSDDEENSITVIGEARTTAVRLDGIAEPGSVVISASTQHRIGLFFETESLGSQRIRGLAQPIELFRVVREAASRNRVELVDPGNLTPLVGRDTELAILKDRWEQAVEELGQVVLLIGDAGLGKSRLIREIREYIVKDAREEPAVIEFRSSQYHQSTGFHPAIEYLSRLLNLEAHAANSDRLRVIEHYLAELGLGTPDNVAVMAGLLSVPLEGKFPPLQVTPQRMKELTDELLRNWLREVSKRRPTLFIIEDLHWLDPTTLDLVTGMVENFEVGRLMAILTFRPEFRTPWRSFPHQTQIALNRLTKRQIADMMKRSAKRQDIPDSVVQQVVERTDGVPLFIEEFTNLVVESGMLDGTGSESNVLNAIPSTLQDLLIARLDRLACDPDVLQLAAAIGREFSYGLLAAACELPPERLQAELEKLVHAELLFQKGQVPNAQYIFKHALIQDSAYRSMLKKRRQQFHAKIAATLEADFPEVVETQPELLAQHFTKAEVNTKAISYWLKAGQKSQASCSVLEAIDAFQQGLRIIATLPEGPERDGLELQFQMPLGGAFVQSRGYAAVEAGTAFDRAREICEKLGQRQMLGFVLTGLWGLHLVRADLDECLVLGGDLLELSELLDDGGLRVEAAWAMTCTYFYLGRFAESVEHGDRCAALYHSHPEKSIPYIAVTGQNAAVTAYGYKALSLFCLGERDAALKSSQSAIDLARRTNSPFSLAMALYHGGWLRLWCGMPAAMRELSNEAVPMNKQMSFTYYQLLETINTAGMGFADPSASSETLEQSIATLRQTIVGLDACGARVHKTHPHSLIAGACLRLGKIAEAHAELDKAFQHQSITGERILDAELHRLRAELQLARGDTAAAHASLAMGNQIAESQQADAWRARMAETKARL